MPIAVQIGALEIAKPLVLWVNDGLMAIFFFLVGLEIKREVVVGQLSSMDRAALPLIGAVGGMAIPALVFVAINWSYPENLNGWAVPAATDIAFALGILALMGTRAPAALKLLLLAIAIIDDLGAIIIIAVFYTEQMSVFSLLFGALGFGVLMMFNRMGITRMGPYIVVGLIIWVAVLKSGVHATLAGVMIAMTIPISGKDADGETITPLDTIEHALAPWVAFAVLPLFAFANAGVPLTGLTIADVLAPLPLGVAAGLFIGKQIGVFGFSRLGVALGWCRLPAGRDVVADLRCRLPDRCRLHHEPVHRHAGLRHDRTAEPGAPRRADRLDPVGHRGRAVPLLLLFDGRQGDVCRSP